MALPRFLYLLFVRIPAFFFFWGVIGSVVVLAYLYAMYGTNMPSLNFMKTYEPAAITRLHASDGQMIAEYARERRFFIPIEAVPTIVQAAFVSAEDKDFQTHQGVDFVSLAGAVVNNAQRWQDGQSFVGASTITQQVAKNFITGGERRVERKLREAFIARHLEREFGKEDILELYLNEIYFGQGAYGIAAAALVYFNKTVEELTLPEAAYLAAVIKGPDNYHPSEDYAEAVGRRNWVIDQMVRNGFVDEINAALAKEEPLSVDRSYRLEILRAPYFAAAAQNAAVGQFGDKAVQEEGLSIRTTLDPQLQDIAARKLRDGLNRYDRRHGWRGPLGQIDLTSTQWQQRLSGFEKTKGIGEWKVGLVYEVVRQEARIVFSDRADGTIPLDALKWARSWRKEQKLGPSVKRATDVLNPGDVVAVSILSASDDTWTLEQIPDVQGALVALDPHSGRVHAVVGGFDYQLSQFNRATQAKRQPGSTFKPFVYLAALDNGYTPLDRVDDSVLKIRLRNGETYEPKNADKRYLGELPLVKGLELSRNTMTLRLARDIGIDQIVGYANKFDIDRKMRPLMSMALGSGETTLLNMVGAYGMLVNGGKHITPSLIDRVQDRYGRTLFSSTDVSCPACAEQLWSAGQTFPVFLDKRLQVAEPRNVFQIISMLRGVMERGTGKRIGPEIDRPVGGKTGTTNNNHDAWFIGFTPDMVVGVWVGFDRPKTLGEGEYGGRAAAPIFRDFVNEAFDGVQPQAFRIPNGMEMAGIDARTGLINLSGSSRSASRKKSRQTDGPVRVEPYDPYRDISVTPIRQNQGNSITQGGIY